MNDHGAMSTELAVLTPILIGLVLFVVYTGRTVEAQADVTHAAYEAARAATLTDTPISAETSATRTAADNIGEGKVSCRTLDVEVDTTAFTAGGHVVVTVTCHASYADLTLLALPGVRSFTSVATAVVDSYRANP